MEDGHKSRILDRFRHLALPEIAVLHIEDEYDYMDDELVEMLKEDIPNVIKQELWGTSLVSIWVKVRFQNCESPNLPSNFLPLATLKIS